MELSVVNKKYRFILLLSALVGIGLFLPQNTLPIFLLLFQIATYFMFMFIVDDLATTPFAVMHMYMLSMMSIPTLIIFSRLILLNPVSYIITSPIYNFIWLFLLTTFVFGFLLSRKIKLSWYGSIERGTGFSFYVQQAILLYVFAYLINIFGIYPIVLMLFISGIIETIVILMQRDQNKNPEHHHFNYLLHMGGRYTGTLSNPIHSAGYLVLLLSSLLFVPYLFQNIIGIILFMQGFFFISIGLFLTQGRTSIISYLTLIFGDIIILYLLQFPLYIQISLTVFLVFMLFVQFYVSKKLTHQYNRFFELKKQDNNSKKTVLEDHAYKYSKNTRSILFGTIFNYLRHNDKYVLKGSGISNVPSTYTETKSKELNLYYPDKLIDSSHNFLLDLYASYGLVGLILSVISYASIFIILLLTGQYILLLSQIIFGIEQMFQFPLQGNLFTIFLLLLMSANYIQISFPSYILYIMLGGQVFISIYNYFIYSKINLSMEHLQLALSLSEGSARHQLFELQTAFYIQPYYDRGYTYLKGILGGNLKQQNKIVLDDLTSFAIMIEDYEKLNIVENEPDFYHNIAYLYVQISTILIQNHKTNIPYYNTAVNKQKYYLFKVINLKPYSVQTLMLLHYYFAFIEHNEKQSTQIINHVIDILVDIYETNPIYDNIAKQYLNSFNENNNPLYNEKKAKILSRWQEFILGGDEKGENR